MGFKRIFFAAFPLVCSGNKLNDFFHSIKDTDSIKFFIRFFSDVRTRNNDGKMCAFLDMDFTLIQNCFEVAVTAAQINKGIYRFKKEDVSKVFGLADANIACQNAVYKDENVKDHLVVPIQEIVNKIMDVFNDKLSVQKDELRPLVAMWNHALYRGTYNIPECQYVRTTFSKRLLYKMPEAEIESLIQIALSSDEKGPAIDKYSYRALNNKTYYAEFPKRVSVYPEMRHLIEALEQEKVTSYLVSASDIYFVEAMAKHLGLEDHNLGTHADGSSEGPGKKIPRAYGSRPTEDADDNMLKGEGFLNDKLGKSKTITRIISETKCTSMIALGDSIGDYYMVKQVLGDANALGKRKPNGYALLINGETELRKNAQDLVNLAKEHGDRAWIQDIDKDGAKWQRRTSTRKKRAI